MEKNTEQAIATLQAFVSTQQPLIDCVKYAIETLQGAHAVTIKEADYTKLNDVISEKEATIMELNTKVETAEAEKAVLATQLEGAINVKESPIELLTETLIKE